MMNDSSQAISPRRRLQSLLAIPDSQRTEAQWDEIIELEISLAPVNQLSPGERPLSEARSAPRQARGVRTPKSTGGNPRPRKPFKKPAVPKGVARGAGGE
ncbi:hypothetical protein SAMN05421693_11436 [Ectothiorhodospira magna]|uniref:Uncharacterized protein n=1 Tax=Ectothiorhodospira magna TaxID=867345 RepID=A0A1H9CKK0_9GAMM|nr:hypothetical protein [Ectothiorhodospira magna]SEQ01735.1 hypothetical protein SAMN05421693_11436 [Ectothiorhodospira magna]